MATLFQLSHTGILVVVKRICFMYTLVATGYSSCSSLTTDQMVLHYSMFR